MADTTIAALEARVEALARLVGMLAGPTVTGPRAGVLSAAQRAVIGVVEEIGFGETMTYGEVAELAESSPQSIGAALDRALLEGHPIPWWRVVPVSGEPYWSLQRLLLAAEGAARA